MITTDCVWCGEIADCDNNGLCDYCQADPEANPPTTGCDTCHGHGCVRCDGPGTADND